VEVHADRNFLSRPVQRSAWTDTLESAKPERAPDQRAWAPGATLPPRTPAGTTIRQRKSLAGQRRDYTS